MQYFDKTFFKFLCGFAVIILISLSIVFVTGIYNRQQAEVESAKVELK